MSLGCSCSHMATQCVKSLWKFVRFIVYTYFIKKTNYKNFSKSWRDRANLNLVSELAWKSYYPEKSGPIDPQPDHLIWLKRLVFPRRGKVKTIPSCQPPTIIEDTVPKTCK